MTHLAYLGKGLRLISLVVLALLLLIGGSTGLFYLSVMYPFITIPVATICVAYVFGRYLM